MIAGALGYPFTLAARKFVSTFVVMFVFTALLMAVDLVFAASGADLVSQNADVFAPSTRGAFQFYNFIIGVMTLFAAALAMGTALIDLGRRSPEQRPSLGDALLLFVLNLKFFFMVMLPVLIVGFIGLAGAGAIAAATATPGEDPSPMLMGAFAIGLLFIPGLIFLFLTVRLFPAWPMALATEEPRLFRAWAVSRGKFWVLLGALILVYVASTAPVFAYGFGSTAVGLMPYAPIEGLESALEPMVLLHIGLTNVVTAAASLYNAAASAYLFSALSPTPGDAADVF